MLVRAMKLFVPHDFYPMRVVQMLGLVGTFVKRGKGRWSVVSSRDNEPLLLTIF